VRWNHFENPKKETHKIHKNKSPFRYFDYVPIGHKKIWQTKKKKFQKDFWKQDPILTFQKFITTILVKVSPKKISH